MAKMRAMPAARLVAGVVALLLLAGTALAKDALPHIKIAIGGANCLCYLPTVLAQQLGAYEQAGVEGGPVNFKGGSAPFAPGLRGPAHRGAGLSGQCRNLPRQNKGPPAFLPHGRL